MNDNNSIKNKVKSVIDQTTYDQLESEIKDNMMKSIQGNDLYDYSSIKEITFYSIDRGIKKQISLNEYINLFPWNNTDGGGGMASDLTYKNRSKFVDSFIDGEKLVIYYNIYKQGVSSGGIPCSNVIGAGQYNVFISNYGRILVLVGSLIMHYPPRPVYYTQYFEYNFWIPTDYISLLNKSLYVTFDMTDQTDIFVCQKIINH